MIRWEEEISDEDMSVYRNCTGEVEVLTNSFIEELVSEDSKSNKQLNNSIMLAEGFLMLDLAQGTN